MPRNRHISWLTVTMVNRGESGKKTTRIPGVASNKVKSITAEICWLKGDYEIGKYKGLPGGTTHSFEGLVTRETKEPI